MREFFERTKRSEMPSVYVHLSGRDVDRALLRYYGIAVEEERGSNEALKPIRCPRCGFENPASFEYCGRCSMLLRVKTFGRDARIPQGCRRSCSLVRLQVLREDPELGKRILKRSGITSMPAELNSGGGNIS